MRSVRTVVGSLAFGSALGTLALSGCGERASARVASASAVSTAAAGGESASQCPALPDSAIPARGGGPPEHDVLPGPAPPPAR